MSHCSQRIGHCDMQLTLVLCYLWRIMKILDFAEVMPECRWQFERAEVPDPSEAILRCHRNLVIFAEDPVPCQRTSSRLVRIRSIDG
jgi:hypothetical protein